MSAKPRKKKVADPWEDDRDLLLRQPHTPAPRAAAKKLCDILNSAKPSPRTGWRIELGSTRYRLLVTENPFANQCLVTSINKRVNAVMNNECCPKEWMSAEGHALDNHRKAMQLYGSEERAVERITLQLHQAERDMDPAVVKRALAFLRLLERGHMLIGESTPQSVWDKKQCRWVKGPPLHTWRVRQDYSNSVLARALGISFVTHTGLSLGKDQVCQLRDRGYILSPQGIDPFADDKPKPVRKRQ